MKNESKGIAVIGVGLIGGSIIRDLKRSHTFSTIFAVEGDPSAAYAKERKIVDAILRYDELPGKVNFIVISSPIFTVTDIAKKINRAFNNTILGEKVIVIDVASVKTSVADVFEKLSSNRVEFVATHPMAGTEFSGLDHARLGMFKGKPWIISRHKKNTDQGINIVQSFIHSFGGRIKALDAQTHDTYAAAVSHTTILLSNYIFDFLSSHYPEALDLAGSGFDSTTRLASGNPELHTSIMGNNTEIVDKIVKEFSVFLGEKPSVNKLPSYYFKNNQLKRDEWIHNKTITPNAKN